MLVIVSEAVSDCCSGSGGGSGSSGGGVVVVCGEKVMVRVGDEMESSYPTTVAT
jgi:hypothetical protein